MEQCPHCGADVSDGATVCDACGGALSQPDRTTDQPRQNRQQGQSQQPPQSQGQHNQHTQGQQHGQHNQHTQGQQHGQQGQYSQHGQQQQGGYGAGGQQGYQQDDSGISRRALLGGGGVVGVLALLGGWFVFFRGSATSSPTNVVNAYFQAIDSGNEQRAQELIHEDATFVPDQSLFSSSDVDISVNGLEVVARRTQVDRQRVQEFATVQFQQTTRGTIDGTEISGTFTEEAVTAHHTSGDWLMWSR